MPVRRPQRFTSRPGRGALSAEKFCARCGVRDVALEKHHWAPRAVFDDADSWPLSYLCLTCHDDWHRKMGWRPRVKTLANARIRRQQRIPQIKDEIEDALYRADYLARMANSFYLLGLVKRWWEPTYPYEHSLTDLLNGGVPAADRGKIFDYIREMDEEATGYRSIVGTCIEELIDVLGSRR